MLDAGNRPLRVLPDRLSLLGCGADDISCQGPLSEVEGSALKKSNRRMLRQAQQSWTRYAILPACLAILPAIGSLSGVEGPALKKSNRRMLRLRSAILDGLSNPGRTQQSRAAQQGCNLFCDGTGYTEACFCSASSGQFQSCRTVNNNFFYFFNEM